jgi:hypothetical protein
VGTYNTSSTWLPLPVDKHKNIHFASTTNPSGSCDILNQPESFWNWLQLAKIFPVRHHVVWRTTVCIPDVWRWRLVIKKRHEGFWCTTRRCMQAGIWWHSGTGCWSCMWTVTATTNWLIHVEFILQYMQGMSWWSRAFELLVSTFWTISASCVLLPFCGLCSSLLSLFWWQKRPWSGNTPTEFKSSFIHSVPC